MKIDIFKVTTDVFDVFVEDECWGRVCYDSYFDCWRVSYNRYMEQFGTRHDAVKYLIEDVAVELNK